jgi:thiamine-phosphate pyrophosphorylase
VIVVITDRRLAPRDEMVARLADIVAAVPDVVVQLREKDLDGGPLFELAGAIAATGARLWINDRVDVALAAGAEGVHLPERGMAIADARSIAPSLRIGCSRHAADGVLSAADAGADVVHLGPIWPTPSKSDTTALGPDALGVGTRLDRRVRLVAVGGIDSPARARQARDAGADGVAVIRAAWVGADPGAAIAAIARALEIVAA